MRKSWLPAIAGAAGLLLAPHAVLAVTITFGSGTDDPIGSTDSNLLAVEGPLDTNFSDPDWLTAVATLAGGGGVNPFVIAKNGAWAGPIAGTNFVNTRAGGASEGATAAYMATFVLPDIDTATLDLSFVTDNSLLGFRINDTEFPTPFNDLLSVTTISDLDIAGSVVVGVNRIFFRAVDGGGPGGYDFLATVEYTEAVDEPDEPGNDVPEPGTMLLLLAGLAALGLRGSPARP